MQKWKAHASLFVANLIYAGNYSIAKEVMPEYITPFGFIVLRVIGALLLFFTVEKILGSEKIQRADFPRLIACGVFGVAINQLMFFKGLSLSAPINAALIMITTPIIVLILSSFILKERLTLSKFFGIALGASGALLIILGTAGDGGQISASLGDIFIMINAISYALYLVLVKPLMVRYHPLTIMKWTFFFGLFIVVPSGIGELPSVEWSAFSNYIWACIFYVVVCTTFFAYLFNTIALNSVSPTVVSAYVYLQPILASLIALLWGKDDLSVEKLLAAALIFSGVYLVSFYPSKPVTKP